MIAIFFLSIACAIVGLVLYISRENNDYAQVIKIQRLLVNRVDLMDRSESKLTTRVLQLEQQVASPKSTQVENKKEPLELKFSDAVPIKLVYNQPKPPQAKKRK